MQLCKTCAHWREGDRRAIGYGGGVCRNPKITEDYGQRTDDMLVYPYNEGGWFWTGPDFGCVHHAAQDLPYGASPDIVSPVG